MENHRVRKIVSGGQTGVDRAALDVAIFCDIPHGGWCPQGRRAEDGRIPSVYELKENRSTDYTVRTEQNVVDSDGTLVLYSKVIRGGTALTIRLANRHRRPHLCIDLSAVESSAIDEAREKTRTWLVENNIGILNVAGPRTSSCLAISKRAESFLLSVFDGRD